MKGSKSAGRARGNEKRGDRDLSESCLESSVVDVSCWNVFGCGIHIGKALYFRPSDSAGVRRSAKAVSSNRVQSNEEA